MQVYLAGPMAERSYDQATQWREDAAFQLATDGINTLSPMRDKEFLRGRIIRSEEAESFKSPWATNKAIMSRDTNDVLTSDAILVNFSGVGDDLVSVGTVMEMTLAWYARIPVIVVAKASYQAIRHPMLSQTVDYLVSSLDDGIHVVRTVLGVI